MPVVDGLPNGTIEDEADGLAKGLGTNEAEALLELDPPGKLAIVDETKAPPLLCACAIVMPERRTMMRERMLPRTNDWSIC